MGSNSSHKRVVTIDNKSSSGVINVSEDVIKCLKDEAKAKGNQKNNILIVFKENSIQAITPTENPVTPMKSTEIPKIQNEVEVKDKNLYWKTKMQEIRKHNSIFEAEFKKSVSCAP